MDSLLYIPSDISLHYFKAESETISYNFQYH